MILMQKAIVQLYFASLARGGTPVLLFLSSLQSSTAAALKLARADAFAATAPASSNNRACAYARTMHCCLSIADFV